MNIVARALKVLAPPPDLTVAEWADKYRRLSAESSAKPGRWRTEMVEYLREPMNMMGKPGVRRITLMTSAQVGKSSFIENTLGFFISQDPCPILHVSPTLESRDMFSKERLAPMVRDTPKLRGLIKDARSRDSDNTIGKKRFPGGILAMVGANAPAGLASRPIRVVLCDEVDRFERSAGTEGDPINLAVKRTTSYWNRVLIFVSTPGNASDSRIMEEYEAGDMRQRWCPCHECGALQVLKWQSVRWDNNDPDTARYECEHCGAHWSDTQRGVAMVQGEWIPQKEWNGNVSYHLNQLYSRLAPLSDGVRDFLEAKRSGDPEMMKTWVNTFLGEPWEEKGKRLEWSDLLENREEYMHPVPEEVTLLTGAVDVQDDRFEIETVGWGDDFRSWSVDYHIIYGDLSTPEPWIRLREYLKGTRMHPLFGEMALRMTAVDSGGHYTSSVYNFCKTLPRVTAIKGVGGAGKPMVGKPSRNGIGKNQFVPLGVDTIKETVVARLKVSNGDPGYCAFPHDRSEDYFRGLTAEELRTRFVKGYRKEEWYKIRPRNEPFDLRVYATAALEMLSVDLNAQRRAELRQVSKETEVVEVPKKRKPKSRKKDNWINGWKNG